MKTSKLKKRMFIGSCPTSELYDKIIKMPSKSHILTVLLDTNSNDQGTQKSGPYYLVFINNDYC
jgi:hypothetical protein